MSRTLLATALFLISIFVFFPTTTADNSYADLTGCISYGTGLCVYVSKDGKKMRAGEARRYYILPKMAAPKVTDEHFHNISKIAWYRGVEKFWVLAESGTEEIYDMKTQAIVSKGEDEMIHVLVVGEFFAKYTCPDEWHIFYHQNYPACFRVLHNPGTTVRFSECAVKCQQVHSQLAVFDNKEQIMMLKRNSLFPSRQNSGCRNKYCQSFWIGTRLPNHAGDRTKYIPYNLDGSPVRFAQWKPGEPNGYGANKNFDERCINMFPFEMMGYSLTKWNDYGCDNPCSGCVCRKSVDRT